MSKKRKSKKLFGSVGKMRNDLDQMLGNQVSDDETSSDEEDEEKKKESLKEYYVKKMSILNQNSLDVSDHQGKVFRKESFANEIFDKIISQRKSTPSSSSKLKEDEKKKKRQLPNLPSDLKAEGKEDRVKKETKKVQSPPVSPSKKKKHPQVASTASSDRSKFNSDISDMSQLSDIENMTEEEYEDFEEFGQLDNVITLRRLCGEKNAEIRDLCRTIARLEKENMKTKSSLKKKSKQVDELLSIVERTKHL